MELVRTLLMLLCVCVCGVEEEAILSTLSLFSFFAPHHNEIIYTFSEKHVSAQKTVTQD
jgi:hypothetical protein